MKMKFIMQTLVVYPVKRRKAGGTVTPCSVACVA